MITITESIYKKMPNDIKEMFTQLPNLSSEEVQSCFPNSKSTSNIRNNKSADNIFKTTKDYTTIGHDDSGNASRFFKSILYYPKASKSERNKGCEELKFETKVFRAGQGLGGQQVSAIKQNFHPTVKPVALISYLIILITPKGGTVLDPFGGSGTTAVSCIENNFNYVIIEKEADHIPIIKARIKAANKEEAPIEEQTLAQLSLNL